MDLLATVRERLKQQYPEMGDIEPAAVESNDKMTIFTFHKETEAEDGAVFPEIIRITVENDTGAILKVEVSKMGPRP